MKCHQIVSATFASFLFAIALTGCLEHRYTITALPEDKFLVEYEARGDRVDIEDGNELLPDSSLWSVKRSIEESEDETTHILNGALELSGIEALSSAMNWKKHPGDTIYFQPIFGARSSWYPFGRKTDIEIKLLSRRFDELYGDIWDFVPEECRILDNDDEMNALPAEEIKMLERKFGLGIIQWNRARYEAAFDRVWQISLERGLLIPDEGKTGFSVSRAGWVDDLHIYLNSIDVGEPQTANLVWWNDVKQSFLNRFSFLVKSGNIDEVAEIADGVEKRYIISKDSEDDRFLFNWTTPGITIKTNGIRNEQTIHWEVEGKDISNDDIVLTASIIQFDTAQLIGVLIIIITGIYFLMRRRNLLKMQTEK